MKKKIKLFCFGFGQVAKYFVKSLIEKNYDLNLITTNTSKTKIEEICNLKHKSYFFSDNKFDEKLLGDLISSNKILISIPPKNKNDIVLENFDKIFKKNKFDWVTYLSATSVYGDKKGKWVDEKTNPQPSSNRGIARLCAENLWLKYYKDFSLPIQIFRLSGIYSIENNIIKRLKAGNVQVIEKKNQFFSRINVEDIAEVLTISLEKFNAGQIFNISDNFPCSNSDVVQYAANLIKMNMPKKISVDEIKNLKLKDFYKDSKKVSNKKMKKFFQYDLKYPSFKEGLTMIKNHII